MPYYRRRPLNDSTLNDVKDVPASLARETTTMVRRLMPFPGAGGLSPDEVPQVLSRVTDTATNLTGAGAMPSSIAEQASALVPRAAAILDEDMARGVMSARDAAPLSQTTATPAMPAGLPYDAGNSLMKDLYAFGERFSALMPQGGATSQSAVNESLPELRGKSAVAAGQGVTLSMQLHNEEARTVRLTPRTTDLLGDSDGRIAASEIAFSKPVLQLSPGERQILTINVTVPVGTAAGYYSGLLVMAGLSELRALICIEVR